MLPLLLALGLLALGTLLLVVGADWFLDGASGLARALGISTLVVGVLLAGLEPEEMLTAALASARSKGIVPKIRLSFLTRRRTVVIKSLQGHSSG